MRLLLIEDDDRIAGPLTEGLGRYGFTVDHVRTGAAGLADTTAAPDLVLLDLGLPDMDGLDVCRSLRARSAVPIIMITARGEEADRIVGLELGADDYLAKPFGVRELIARIRAVTRRSGAPAYTPIEPAETHQAHQPASGAQTLGPLTLNRRTREVHLDGQPVALTPREFDLLAFLADDPGTVCSRQQIMDTVWDPHFFGPTKTLDAHVAALRRKLGDPGWITTARGVGFRLTVPGDHTAAEATG
ncbi:DNA-binding response regulator, OmpR family, contains REC and winged-helix (wHTH) domain [Streptomyces sp. yr375]|uniref:response regulator transcription factor n=1 Tax=Streptomyces sp. yr375 TaxID=1761906 RepID=UPI0008D450D8|nr:response regulator transcription factor [Streptomyces sp. yr375]SES31113.1 DNA-binding response regulator, OmpR family, contains REC and winged-helix (wHTH) domain [Streptomyces sp. yr375]